VRTFLRNNGLSVAAVGLFLVVWIGGQSTAGMRAYNEEQVEHGEQPVSYGEYLTSAHFGEATFENWESEFLQMGAYVLLTVWLRQRGSAESKDFDGPDSTDEDPARHRGHPDAPWPVRHGGLAATIYRNSLSIGFFTLFVLSWFLHAVTGAREYSADQVVHGGQPVDTWQFLHRAEFWFQSMQNWQSEFLAVASLVVLTIFLRQQGSPQSKPVHASHAHTGSS
jgi:hypothetical protein